MARRVHPRPRFLAALLLAGGLAGGCATTREGAESPVTPTAEADALLEPGEVADVGVAASNAMSRITRARDALEKEQVTRAQKLLEASLADMDHIYTWLPEEPLYGAVDSAVAGLEREEAEVDFGPLVERVRARQDALPAGVVADVEMARLMLEEGERAEALSRLRSVREVLARELLVFPLDEARARVRRARADLEAGRPGLAGERLEGVTELLDEVRTFTPLVPARWRVRASAAAAARGEWDRSERLLREAVRRLSQFRGTPDSPLTPVVEELEAEAMVLLERMEGPRRPTPLQLQLLAERMSPTPAVGGAGSF